MDKEITVKVDAELLDKVMKITQFKTPDDAVEEGLQMIAGVAWLEGTWSPMRPHLRPQESKNSIDPNYDPDAPYSYNAMPAGAATAHAQ